MKTGVDLAFPVPDRIGVRPFAHRRIRDLRRFFALPAVGATQPGTPWSFLTRFGSGDGWQGDIRHLLFFHFWGAQETQKEPGLVPGLGSVGLAIWHVRPRMLGGWKISYRLSAIGYRFNPTHLPAKVNARHQKRWKMDHPTKPGCQ